MNKVAIIGSGFTALSLALHLPKNVQITMFDKSRKPGGRVSTRITRQHPGYSFDHGLAFVEAGQEVTNFLTSIQAIKQVKLRWCSSWEERSNLTFRNIYSGNPNVESIAVNFLQKIQQNKEVTACNYDTRVAKIVEVEGSEAGQLKLISQNMKQYGPFNFVYVCIPFPQCVMLSQNIVQLPEDFNGQEYFCNWVVMVGGQKNSEISEKLKDMDVCEKFGQNIGKMVSQNWKNVKTDDSLWVFHMTEKWSEENKNISGEDVQKQFLKEITDTLKIQDAPKYVKAHRWLYARPKNTPKQILMRKNVAMGADWVGGGTDIEHCWNVGKDLAKLLGAEKSCL